MCGYIEEVAGDSSKGCRSGMKTPGEDCSYEPMGDLYYVGCYRGINASMVQAQNVKYDDSIYHTHVNSCR